VAKVANYIRAHASESFQFVIISLKGSLYERGNSLVGIYRDQDMNSSRTLTLDVSVAVPLWDFRGLIEMTTFDSSRNMTSNNIVFILQLSSLSFLCSVACPCVVIPRCLSVTLRYCKPVILRSVKGCVRLVYHLSLRRALSGFLLSFRGPLSKILTNDTPCPVPVPVYRQIQRDASNPSSGYYLRN